MAQSVQSFAALHVRSQPVRVPSVPSALTSPTAFVSVEAEASGAADGSGWRRMVSTAALSAAVAGAVYCRQARRVAGAGWRSRRKAAFVRQSHEHEDESHDHEVGHSHEHAHEHSTRSAEAGKDGSHGHSHSHSHGHDHDHSHEQSHAHDQRAHGHDDHHAHSHGHGNEGLYGHGHSHGEVPDWLPGAPAFRRLSDLSRTKASIITVTSVFLLSLLPLGFTRGCLGLVARGLRFGGPALVFFVYGLPALSGALQHAAQLDIHFLMTLAAFASVGIGHAQEGAMLLLLFALSEVLEEKLSMRARASLDALGSLCPETCRRLRADVDTLADAEHGDEVPVVDLRAGDRIFVRAGEVIPVDCRILDGLSQLGLSHLTGEPLPQEVSPGDSVSSGAVTIDGALLLEVQREAEQSTLQRLAKLTSGAKASRPKLVTLVDAVADRWSFAVVVSTMVIAAAPPLIWHAPIGPSLYRSLVWLITASPCALILATPLVYVSGLSVAAANGVLLKGGRTLDALAVASGVAFDKTGTLTTGTPVLQSVEEVVDTSRAEEEGDQDANAATEPLLYAASLGRLSVHPVSRAVVAALPKGNQMLEVTGFQMLAGAGVTGSLSLEDGRTCEAVMGRPEFVSSHLEGSNQALAETLHSRAAKGAKTGSVVMALALKLDHQAQAWLFHLEDRVKDAAQGVVSEVARGGPVYMLTGDRLANAENVVASIGASNFEAVHADLRPEDKLAKVREYDTLLRETAGKGSWKAQLLKLLGVSMGGLVMVGDGINDAPALAAATAGISLEAQSDGLQSNAVDGSDVLILRRAGDPRGDSELKRVSWLLALSRKARGIVIQNICLALGSIIGASSVTLVSGMPLWLGVLLHEGTTMLVGLNSLRLFSNMRSTWRPLFSRYRTKH